MDVTLYVCALEIIHILAYANSITNEVLVNFGLVSISQLSLHQWQVSKPYSKKTSLKDSSLLGCYAL
jgi:hypothetical protein